MRTVAAFVVGAAVAAGVGGGAGRPPSVDMVAASVHPDSPSGAHLMHWVAPVVGMPKFLAWSTHTAGVGAGTMEFTVMTDGVEVCSLSVPCTQVNVPTPAIDDCPDAELGADLRVDVAFSHTCDTLGEGTIAAGFEWAR